MIARNLTGLFHLQGFEVAICADRKSRFSDIAFYESPSPIPTRRIRSRYGTTPEEYFEDHGAFSTSFNHVGLFRLPQNDVLFIAPEVSREKTALMSPPWVTPMTVRRPETSSMSSMAESIRAAAAGTLSTLPA